MQYNWTKNTILLQAQKTKWNLLLINLLVSDLSIIFIGIPLEAIGAFSKGQAMNHVLCRITAFTHTLSGSIIISTRINLLITWAILY